ncbi:uncharacterized protein LOC124632605 [Helicoverpa zea]|uniref:uncharacterized protein LOC124632605 n=1 Tax=Helicoverpa zea TaxID=7113 RepID=UPI001F55CC1D|nr:uncharacterized protein LOC124632605 [Helicoverpa zea]
MYNNESQFNDPKGQGQPPPYTDTPPSDVRNTPYTDNAPPPNVQYAQQPQYPPPPMMARPGVVYQGNVNVVPGVIPVVVGPQMGPKESPMTCPSCNHQIVTRVEYKSNMRTHLFAALLCIVGCWPCAFVPYFVDSCRNADHYCPNCSAYIGSYVSKTLPPPYTDENLAENAPQTSGVVYQANVIPVVIGPQMGPKESPMSCPSCNQQIVTRIEYKSTTKTHLFAALLCCIGCWPCVCIPYCVHSCQNADHYCPNCSAYIGSYKS